MCQICGALATGKEFTCPICGSRLSAETGNPYTEQGVFQKKLVSISSIFIAIALAVNVGLIGVVSKDLGAFAQNYLTPAPSVTLPAEVIPETDGTGTDGFESGGESEEPDPSWSEGSEEEPLEGENTISLTDEQWGEGFVESETGGIAWRWLTDDERIGLACSDGSSVCGWVKVVALRDCAAVLINADLSDSPSTNTKIGLLIGYGNGSIDSAQMSAGDEEIIEVNSWSGTYNFPTWTYMSYIGCESAPIPHD
jgi:hypothetical protein